MNFREYLNESKKKNSISFEINNPLKRDEKKKFISKYKNLTTNYFGNGKYATPLGIDIIGTNDDIIDYLKNGEKMNIADIEKKYPQLFK